MNNKIQATPEQLDTFKEIQDRASVLRERVDRLYEQPEVKIPEIEIDTSSAEELIDNTPTEQLSVLEEKRQRELDRLEREREQVREERASLTDELRETFESRQSMEEKLKETQQDFGVIEMLDKQREQLTAIQDLRNRATTLIEQRDAAIGAIGQQAIATPFITGQQARIAENYDRRINTISAYMGTEVAMYEAQQGNIQIAQSMVAQIVDAYTYDTKMELEKVSTFIDLNSDEISMLDQEYQNTLQESQRYWENKLQEEKAEREAVLNLKLQYATAGITIDDDLETAVEKSSKWLGIQPDADVRELMANYPGAGIEEKDTFTEAIKKITELQAQQIPESPRVFGGQQTGYYTWAYDEASKSWVPRQITGGTIGADSGTGGGVDEGTGETGMSITLERILSGEGSLEDLTSTQRKDIQDEAFRFGLYNQEPPDYFINEAVDKLGPMSMDKVSEMWNEYRGNILTMDVPDITEDIFYKYFPVELLEDKAMKEGFVIEKRFGKDKPDVEAYVDSMMQSIEMDREFGLTEEEIYNKYF
jgi:hypothetical protein